VIFVHVDLSVGSITTRRTDKRSTPSGCPTTSDRFAQRALGGHPERLNDIRSAQSDTYAPVEGYCRKARLPNPNLARYGMGQRFRVSSSPARCCRCLCRHSGPKLIRNLRVVEGLNTITRRGEIGTGTLVLGVAAHSLALSADNKRTERRQFHRFAAFQTVGDFLEHQL